jgi:hypothetical protein
MKKLILTLALTASSSAFSQNITGGGDIGGYKIQELGGGDIGRQAPINSGGENSQHADIKPDSGGENS